MKKYFFSLDVESVGLYGPAFAFGWTVSSYSDEGGEIVIENRIEEDACQCSLHSVKRNKCYPSDLEWVKENVIPKLNEIPSVYLQSQMFTKFLQGWKKWKERGALLVADVPFPVETNFLASALDVVPQEDLDQYAVYPLIDVATYCLSAGLDPLASYERAPGETLAHNPLHDARQSLRILLDVMLQLDAPENEE